MTDEVGTIPALDIPDEPHRKRYACTKCGGENVTVVGPSLDPRYSVGRCSNCTPLKKGRRKGRDITYIELAILREIA
jgi:DNA-directed RNA polymerase subunit RPC12/RpoP